MTARSFLAPAGLLVPLALLSAPTCDNGPRAPAPRGTAQEPATGTAPRARLRLSGFLQGRLEPCGCASGQLGGLPRRAFFIRQDRRYDLLIEGGNLVAGGTPLDLAKLETALTVLTMPGVGYHALGLGPADLELPLAELATFLEVLFPDAVISSDLVPPEDRGFPVRPFTEHPAGEAKVRLAALTLAVPPGEAGAGFRLLSPAEAWQRAMAGAADSTLRVLLVHGPPAVARAQAELDPRPDLIVGITDEVPEPPGQPEPVGGVPLVFPGTRGRMLVDVTLTRIDGRPQLTRYEVVRLAGSETAKGAMEDDVAKEVLLAHRHGVAAAGILGQMANRLPTPNGATYVGSKVCADCHEQAFAVWKGTKHARAWATLEEAEKGTRYGWPVTAYPDCVACHVVGYGYQSGFVGPDETPHLKDVGCEQCHGPGSAHVEDETVSMKTEGVNSCLGCHDFEQSPDFAAHYEERWKKIEHYLDK